MNEKNASAPALREAISLAGSQSALGRLMGHSQVLVHKWLNSSKPLGEKHCVKLEKLLGIQRARLRPDDWQQIWPELVTPPCCVPAAQDAGPAVDTALPAAQELIHG